MAAYQNKNERSVLASVDFDDSNSTAFFTVHNEADVDRAKDLLTASGLQILAQSYVKGHTIIIGHCAESKDALFKTLSTKDSSNFEPAVEPKPNFLQFLRKNGWKIRGGSSVVGQSMTLFSAFNAVSKADADAGRLKPKFDPAIGAFATLNLAANFVNYIFGGQKEEDVAGLDKFDKIIADEVNRYLPKTERKVSPDDVRKLSYMNEAELAEHNKDRSAVGVIRRNSVQLGEVGLRTLGSICMMFNYRKIPKALGMVAEGNLKEAFLTAKVEDKNTFLAGCGMVTGKIMGLLAKTDDPNTPSTGYIDELRRKVLWITSSYTEMIAQSSVALDRYRNKRLVIGGKAQQDITGIAGNILLTVPPYPTRLVLPYGEKVLDSDEVQARLLDELPKLPQDKIPEVAARVTARMVEHMGEKSPSFSELYKDIMHKLEAFHEVCILPKSTEEDVSQDTHFADKVERKATSNVATEKRETLKTNTIQNIVSKDPAPAAASPAQLG